MMGPACELASDSSGFVTNWASGSFASCPAWYRKLMFQRKVPLSSVTNATLSTWSIQRRKSFQESEQVQEQIPVLKKPSKFIEESSSRSFIEKAVLLWLQDSATRDATLLKKAFCEDRLNLRVATEIICSRTSSQIQQLKPLYFNMYRVYLEHEIEHQTHGHHKKMLLKYLATPRYEGPEVDQLMVGDDARAHYKAGEKRLGTDEKTFIRIFCERSRAHLTAISEAYLRLYERPLEKAVKHETSGHFERIEASGCQVVATVAGKEAVSRIFAKEKVAILQKRMKGFRIYKLQGTFLWQKMGANTPSFVASGGA
ncbi:Annexin [Heracleum sosnowskyi]|uniref:Annexin n=1 Tax=Heracleum sosnowskyi TaxID=360622 RepID=A0AAD8IF27_9APIA|nr:Annexin [Heracleum sosnowskyi]